MKKLAVLMVTCGAVLLVYSLRYLFPSGPSHASLGSITVNFLEARIETALGGILIVAGLYLFKTHP